VVFYFIAFAHVDFTAAIVQNHT